MSKHINIGTESPEAGFDRFIDVWTKAEKGEAVESAVYLNFEDLQMLLAVLSPKRLELMKKLHGANGMSVRALAKALSRDYKNVHSDVQALEQVGLLTRTENGLLDAPWDGIDAHLSLTA